MSPAHFVGSRLTQRLVHHLANAAHAVRIAELTVAPHDHAGRVFTNCVPGQYAFVEGESLS